MILPTKHIPLRRSILGLGAVVLGALNSPKTVSALWDALRANPDVVSFDRFILALDLLFATNAIEMREGLLRRRTA